jgi:ribose 5-phosphate isomerase B
MIVAIGSDHRGIAQRQWVADEVQILQHELHDLGTHSTESCDYPDIAEAVAREVASGAADMGVLICGTGIGVSIAANKVHGVRAALCHDLHTAQMSRRHNNANVLCLPGDALSEQQVKSIVHEWFLAEFEGDRHQRRVDKIGKIAP